MHKRDSKWWGSCFIGLSVALAACGVPETPEVETTEPEAAQQQLTRATLGGPKWAVALYINGGLCSASVINEHWLLTSAHCLNGTPGLATNVTVQYAPAAGQAETVYTGPTKLYPHPSGSAGNSTKEYDIGLVQLLGYGIDTAKTGRAKFYADPSFPWRNPNADSRFRYVSISGWGLATIGRTGSTNCATGTAGRQMLGTNYALTISPNELAVSTRVQPAHPCDGDSGGPWFYDLTNSTGVEPVQLAVESRTLDGIEYATLVKAHLGWLESTLQANSAPYGSYCSSSTLSNSVVRQCQQLSLGWSDAVGLGGKCMEPASGSVGAPVRLAPCNSSVAQMWSRMPNGEIRSGANASLCLDVPGGSATNGNRMQLYTCNATLAQRFGYTAQGEIRSGLSWNKCVEVQGGFTANGTPIQLYDCNWTASQWWSW
ncbi:MAG: ricin-type beta-trefoil lectin domain protein [Myxococcaceae bacterium]|nr:ricin-type beta-trefoil lectin domain protein [Myxococcaceae bacterium]